MCRRPDERQVGFAVGADQVDVPPVGVASCQHGRVDVRAATNVRVPTGGGEHDVPVGQVDRIDVVVM